MARSVKAATKIWNLQSQISSPVARSAPFSEIRNLQSQISNPMAPSVKAATKDTPRRRQEELREYNDLELSARMEVLF
jgi:hypothetical protein